MYLDPSLVGVVTRGRVWKERGARKYRRDEGRYGGEERVKIGINMRRDGN